MHLRRVVEPATLPVGIEEAKARLRVTSASADGEIGALIAAAVSYLDGWRGILGMCLEAQTWEGQIDAFPVAEIELPLGPVTSIASLRYLDPAGVEQTVAPADYALVDAGAGRAWLYPAEDFPWPATLNRPGAVRVSWVAGEGCPPALKEAVLARVEEFYDRPSGPALEALRRSFADLIAPFRRHRI